jgi:hypothetical protein
MITLLEVKSLLASPEPVRFKELETDRLYLVKMFDEDVIMVRPMGDGLQGFTEVLSPTEFVERFDELWACPGDDSISRREAGTL